MFTSQVLLFLGSFAACSSAIPRRRTSGQNHLAPLFGIEHSEAIPNEYLVEFQPGYTHEQHFKTIGRNLTDSARFARFSFGYRANLDNKTRDELIRRDPGVQFVETNRLVNLIRPVKSANVESPDMLLSNSTHSKREYNLVDGEGSPYGLQMLTTGSSSSKLKTPISNNGVYNYYYGAGQGVQVYVMDTGIRTTHKLFQGRARHFGDLASTEKSPYINEPMEDENGHGTHVSGTVAAAKYGVAPFASLINVKVLGKNGRGDLGQFSQAIHDITMEHIANKKKHGDGFWKFRGSLINMSLGWPGRGYTVLNRLIAANEAGISVFAAAGNDDKDASNEYPCANVQTRCIAAVDNNYKKAWFSNYGGVVNFIAPGDNILSLGIKSDTALEYMSGTSQACPHGTGAAAVFASWQGLTTSYDLAQNFVYWNSISGVVSGFKSGTTDYLVTTGIHSPKKYPKEPFRFAGDYPYKNHIVLPPPEKQTIDSINEGETSPSPSILLINPTVQTPPPASPSDLATAMYSPMPISTFAPLSGFTTEPGDLLWDPVVVTPTPTPTPTSTLGGACVGNQIQGTCSQASLPSTTPDSGPQPPVCNKVDTGPYLMFNSTQAASGVATYCSNLISDKWVLSSSNSSPTPGYIANAAENGGYLAITVLFDVDSCDPGTASADQNLDFSTWTQDKCYEYLYTNLAETCAKDSTWSDFNPDYSLEGGVYGASCALWAQQGLPGSPPSNVIDG